MALRGMSDTVAGPECEPHPNEYQGEEIPQELTHDVETVDEFDGPDYEKCRACEKVARGINPFEECPEKERPSDNCRRIQERAELAEKRDHSLYQFDTVGMRDDSMVGIPAWGDD